MSYKVRFCLTNGSEINNFLSLCASFGEIDGFREPFSAQGTTIVEVSFADKTDGESAAKNMNGMIVGDEVIRATFLSS